MKHFVLTYMEMDGTKTYATYEGEFYDFPVKEADWIGHCLVVPNWFNSMAAAMEYIEKLGRHDPQTYVLVQERHYAKGDPRIAEAKIIGSIQNDFPIPPSQGVIQKKSGEIEVLSMYFMNLELAEQYVSAFNADIAATIALREKLAR
jgi:hypothetical protein